MNKADIPSASFLIVCPENKCKELKLLFSNHFPEASIYGFASIKLEKNFTKNSKAIQQFNDADWIILSSSFATKIFLEEFNEEITSKTKIKIKSFASVGPSISQLLNKNKIEVKLESTSFNINGLEEAFKNEKIADKNFLFITGNKSASGGLMELLTKRGGKCSQLIMYSSTTNYNIDLQPYKDFLNSPKTPKIICFSSPETVSSFQNILLKENLKTSKEFFIACLGPLTEERAKSLFPNNKTKHAPKYSYDGLIQLCTDLSTY